MKTQEQIVERIKLIQDDVLGFELYEYFKYLDFEHAKEFLKEGVTEWGEIETRHPKELIIGYMSFAFEKAHSQRGISANRSIMHMVAWSWMYDDELFNKIDHEYKTNYHSYGLPILRMVCEHVGINPKEHGDK